MDGAEGGQGGSGAEILEIARFLEIARPEARECGNEYYLLAARALAADGSEPLGG